MRHLARANIVPLFALVFFAFLAPLPASAADLSFSPSTMTMEVGKEFSIKVLVDPGADTINAADGNIIFDRDILSVVSVSKEGSLFSLWTADPTFSNSDGTIVFSGGTPSAVSNKGTVITITFKGKQLGTAKVSVTKASILAADGKGTNVYKSAGEETITITEAKVQEAAAEEEFTEDLANGPTPLAPVITTPTNRKEEDWYATSTVQFDWVLPADVIGVRSLLSDSESISGDQLKSIGATATSTVLLSVKEGASYYYLQFRNDSGWGALTKRKIQVDLTPPDEFEIKLLDQGEDAEVPKFSFGTTDAVSGIDRYEIIFGEQTVATARAADLTNGSYPVPPQEGGPQKVRIKAHDKAGNMREASADFTLPKVDKPKEKTAGEEDVPTSAWTLERILTILFALTIGALAAWNWSLKTNSQKSRANLLRRVSETVDKNNKVFTAMREEFEQMVNDFDAKPQLTPEERQFLENIKEVLDISEEIVDSSMDELKRAAREL